MLLTAQRRNGVERSVVIFSASAKNKKAAVGRPIDPGDHTPLGMGDLQRPVAPDSLHIDVPLPKSGPFQVNAIWLASGDSAIPRNRPGKVISGNVLTGVATCSLLRT